MPPALIGAKPVLAGCVLLEGTASTLALLEAYSYMFDKQWASIRPSPARSLTYLVALSKRTALRQGSSYSCARGTRCWLSSQYAERASKISNLAHCVMMILVGASLMFRLASAHLGEDRNLTGSRVAH